MPYSQFKTISQVKEAFNLTLQETFQFFPAIDPISPSTTLESFLSESLPLVAAASEKARSEGIIYPILLEVRRYLKQQISLFSGEDFTVDESVGLNGICDFLLTRSPKVLTLEAPVIIVTEAKKAELSSGFGQCIAEMVAAQRFNQAAQSSANNNVSEAGNVISTIYGCVTSGTQWRFLKLEEQVVTISLKDYPLPPVEQILSFLIWMVQQH